MQAARHRFIAKFATALLPVALAAAGTAAAGTYTWLQAPASAAWNTTDPNWWDDSAVGPWINAADNHAVFSYANSSQKTISAGATTLGNLTFSTDGYVIAGGSLAMNGNATVSTGTAVLQASVSRAAGAWTRTGAGTLVLDPGAGRTNALYALKNDSGTLRIVSGATVVTGSTVEGEYKLTDTFHNNGGAIQVWGGLLKTTGTGWVAQNGTLAITNGVVDFTSLTQVLNAYGASASTTVSGAGVLDVTELRVTQFNGGYDKATINLNVGGTLRLHRFYHDTASSSTRGSINFGGGALVAKSSRTDFLGTTSANWRQGVRIQVREGGAIIDSNGYTIDSKQPFHSGAAVDGGLVKRGAGTFTLATTNGYNGATSVEAGTLKLGVDNALPSGATVVVKVGATFDLNGKTLALGGLGGAGAVANGAGLTITGAIAPGDGGGVGTLTLAVAPASLVGAQLAITVLTNGVSDRLHVDGDLDLDGMTLVLDDPVPGDQSQAYVVASCTGALQGKFESVVQEPSKWRIVYAPESKQVLVDYRRASMFIMR